MCFCLFVNAHCMCFCLFIGPHIVCVSVCLCAHWALPPGSPALTSLCCLPTKGRNFSRRQMFALHLRHIMGEGRAGQLLPLNIIGSQLLQLHLGVNIETCGNIYCMHFIKHNTSVRGIYVITQNIGQWKKAQCVASQKRQSRAMCIRQPYLTFFIFRGSDSLQSPLSWWSSGLLRQ